MKKLRREKIPAAKLLTRDRPPRGTAKILRDEPEDDRQPGLMVQGSIYNMGSGVRSATMGQRRGHRKFLDRIGKTIAGPG